MKLLNKSIPQLKKLADKLTSELVRKKYANWKGEVACYTCDKIFLVKEIQAGHYISRNYINLRWFLDNIRPQCVSCNVFKRGNMDEFALRLEREIPGILEKLNTWKHHPSTPLKRLDMIFLIEGLKKNLLALDNQS